MLSVERTELGVGLAKANESLLFLFPDHTRPLEAKVTTSDTTLARVRTEPLSMFRDFPLEAR